MIYKSMTSQLKLIHTRKQIDTYMFLYLSSLHMHRGQSTYHIDMPMHLSRRGEEQGLDRFGYGGFFFLLFVTGVAIM